jgi:hypothetical protein
VVNERIKQFYEQCNRVVNDPFGGAHISFDHQMFAELVVRECALTAGLMERAGRPNIGAGILDSFGVEE